MKSNRKGHQIRTSWQRGEGGERGIARNSNGPRRVKRIELQKRESGTERTSRNKTVISRHFTHERERLADSTCVPVLGTLLPTAWNDPPPPPPPPPPLFPIIALSRSACTRLGSFIPLYFSPLLSRPPGLFLSRSGIPLSPLHPRPRLAEKYCSRWHL